MLVPEEKINLANARRGSNLSTTGTTTTMRLPRKSYLAKQLIPSSSPLQVNICHDNPYKTKIGKVRCE